MNFNCRKMSINYAKPIRDLYGEMRDIYSSKRGGWCLFYYGVLTELINKNKFKKVVEVGVGYGFHAKELLMNSCLEHLSLIDPMRNYDNDCFARDIMSTIPSTPGNQFNELFELINEELSPWKEKYTWFRKPSLEITIDEIPDESIDCVFVDGDHSYDAVVKDLEFWWQKVKTNGVLLGDDYQMSDVARAVHSFATKYSLEVKFAENHVNPSYKIFMFQKCT